MTHPVRRQAPLPIDEGYTPSKAHVIANAHQDDVHGLIRISPTCFASGSKDGSLKVWDLSGRLISIVNETVKIDYRRWITALTPIPGNRFLSGTRDGSINMHDEVGNITETFLHAPNSPIASCKERNQNRITCLAASSANQIFIGTPTGFTHYDPKEKKEQSTCQTSARDWVYCIHPLNDNQVLAATGTELEIWESNRSHWTKKTVVQSQKEEPRTTSQRPFISAIEPVTSYPHIFAVAVFDGSVRVRDITTGKELKKFKEHEGRVWSVVNINRGVLASCADDATVKIWDARQKKSVLTLTGFPGRVSALLPLENYRLITASCPDNVKNSPNKAELSFWDLR